MPAKKEEGLLGTKGNAKSSSALLEKKLVKKGKKEGEYFRYFITKPARSMPPPPPAARRRLEPTSAPACLSDGIAGRSPSRQVHRPP